MSTSPDPVNAAVNLHLANAFDASGNYVPEAGVPEAATLMLDQLARLAKAFIPLRRELAASSAKAGA